MAEGGWITARRFGATGLRKRTFVQPDQTAATRPNLGHEGATSPLLKSADLRPTQSRGRRSKVRKRNALFSRYELSVTLF